MSNTSLSSIGVYSHVLAHCEPYTFAPQLEFLGTPGDAWRFPREIGDLQQSLAEKFSVEVLAAAGISGPRLDLLQGQPFIALRNGKAEVVELLFAGGCLSRTLPIIAVLRDSHTLKLRGEAVLLALTIDDVIVLRQCGLPATVIADFEGLGPANLDEFCALVGAQYRRQGANGARPKTRAAEAAQPAQPGSPWPKVGPRGQTAPPFVPKEARATAPQPPESQPASKRWKPKRLIALAFSLCGPGVDSKIALAGVAAHVKDLESAYSFDDHDICYCELSPMGLGRLNAAMRFQDTRVLKDALCAALEDYGDWQSLNRPPPAPTTLGSRWMGFLNADPRIEAYELELYQRKLRSDLVVPLFNLSADDPLELQMLQLQAAHLVELSATHAAHMARRLGRVQPRYLAPEDPIFPMQDLNATLALSAQMLRVCAAMSRVRNSK